MDDGVWSRIKEGEFYGTTAAKGKSEGVRCALIRSVKEWRFVCAG
jgi:hypothetical protein